MGRVISFFKISSFSSLLILLQHICFDGPLNITVYDWPVYFIFSSFANLFTFGYAAHWFGEKKILAHNLVLLAHLCYWNSGLLTWAHMMHHVPSYLYSCREFLEFIIENIPLKLSALIYLDTSTKTRTYWIPLFSWIWTIWTFFTYMTYCLWFTSNRRVKCI